MTVVCYLVEQTPQLQSATMPPFASCRLPVGPSHIAPDAMEGRKLLALEGAVGGIPPGDGHTTTAVVYRMV